MAGGTSGIGGPKQMVTLGGAEKASGAAVGWMDSLLAKADVEKAKRAVKEIMTQAVTDPQFAAKLLNMLSESQRAASSM